MSSLNICSCRNWLQEWGVTNEIPEANGEAVRHYARPLKPSSLSFHEIQTLPPANHTPSIRLILPTKELVSCLPSDVHCCILCPGMCCCLRVRMCFVVGGISCLLILSSHCSQWLTRDNHVLFSRVVFLGRHVGLCPSLSEAVLALAFCLSDQV